MTAKARSQEDRGAVAILKTRLADPLLPAIVFGILAVAVAAYAFLVTSRTGSATVDSSDAFRVYALSLAGASALAMGQGWLLVNLSAHGDAGVQSGVRWLLGPPMLMALTFVAIAGPLLPSAGGIAPAPLLFSTPLPIYLAYEWPALILWTLVAVLDARVFVRRARGGEIEASGPRVVITRQQVIAASPAFAILVILLVLVGLTPSVTHRFAVDGDLSEWNDVPLHADPTGDERVVAQGSGFSLTYVRAGTYEVLLNVTDSGGASAETSMRFSVPNVPPTAAFTTTVVGLNASFDAAGSRDPNGTLVSSMWFFGDGAGGQGLLTEHTYAWGGRYNVTLIVTDSEGATASVTSVVIIQGPDQPPIPAISHRLVNYTLNASAGSSFDPGGSITSYLWDFGDGQTGSSRDVSYTYTIAGNYSVRLTVTDNSGSVSSTSVPIRVPNAPPVVQLAVTVDSLTVISNASGSSDDGRIVAFDWSFGDGTVGEGPVITHQYAIAGQYAIVITVRDDGGAETEALQLVAVTQGNPATFPPAAHFTCSTQGFFVSCDASASYDPDGVLVGYSWGFGDGNTGFGRAVDHLYTLAGVYQIRLTVVDDWGLASATAQAVDLRSANRSSLPPIPRISIRVTDYRVDFDGDGSSAPQGDVVVFRWTLLEPEPSLDLSAVRFAQDGSFLYFLVEASGPVFALPNATTSLSFYIETGRSNVGYDIGSLRADFLLEITGSSGAIERSQLFWYIASAFTGVAGSWQLVSGVSAASGGSAIETRISDSVLLLPVGASLRFTCGISYAGMSADVLDESVTT